jgi:twitching motility two-component system response regulator PilH
MRLLVADDSATIRKLAEICFRNSSWSLDFAATGAEAVSKAQSGPDVMLLDYILPDMKAADVCRRLAADPRSANIPVVMVSSRTSGIRDELRGFSQVVGYLAKPFSTDELTAHVNAALKADTSPRPERPSAAAAAPAPVATLSERRAVEATFKLKEAAAKTIYARLRRHLERLPEWAAERGDQPPAPYFARKLLTGEVVEGLLTDLAPLCRPATEPNVPEAVGPSGEATALQRELELLRRPSVWQGGEPPPLEVDLVYDRASGFSGKLRQLQLSASEQRVLTVVDGRLPLRVVAERTGIAPREVSRILARLAKIELVRSRHTLRVSTATTVRTLAVLDPDRQGVHEALQTLLRRRRDLLEVRDLGAEPDQLAAIVRDRPCLVLLNSEGTDLDIAEMARQIRRTEALANTSLAAVLERHIPARVDQLAAAGFDAVWVKPLHFRDVSQLIASSFLAAELVSGGSRLANNDKESHVHHSHH